MNARSPLAHLRERLRSASEGGGLRGTLAGRLAALVSGVRFGQFVSVGVLGAVVDSLVLAGLVELAGLAPEVAKIGAWEAAVVFIFVANERWTFEGWGSAGRLALARRFLTSNAIRVGGLAVTLAVLWALSGLGVWYLAANVVGIGVGFLVNYVFENLLTWRVGAD
jgi:putative flippase GtrA